jgi:hypothetical protein
MARQALSRQPLGARDEPGRLASLTLDQLKNAFSSFESAGPIDQTALLIVGWYKGSPWSDAELAEKAKTLRARIKELRHPRIDRLDDLCQRLGVTEELKLTHQQEYQDEEMT